MGVPVWIIWSFTGTSAAFTSSSAELVFLIAIALPSFPSLFLSIVIAMALPSTKAMGSYSTTVSWPFNTYYSREWWIFPTTDAPSVAYNSRISIRISVVYHIYKSQVTVSTPTDTLPFSSAFSVMVLITLFITFILVIAKLPFTSGRRTSALGLVLSLREACPSNTIIS